MEDERLILRRQRRERLQEYKDQAATSCYSIILVIVALVVLRPLMVDQILSRADAFCDAGMLDESQRQCDKALLIDDDNSLAWCQLARIHKIRGDREMAYSAYERAVQADDTNRSANYELAMMYMDDEKHELAIPYLERVGELGPDRTKDGIVGQDSYHQAALYMLVLCYQKVGDPAKTEVALKEMRVLYPGSRNPEDHPQPSRQNNPSR